MDLHEIEAFALADDRTELLAQLIPGTADFYFYSCLHHQQRGELDQVGPLLTLWRERHGQTRRLTEIENRQAMLRWDSPASKERIRHQIGLLFDHQRQQEGKLTDHPSSMDPAVVLRSLRTDALGHGHLQRFTDRALLALVGEGFKGERRRELLNRLRRPDCEGLVELLAADVGFKNSGGFGSLPIHRLLLREQLEALAKRRPELMKDRAFIETFLSRLQPDPDTDVEADDGAREVWLDRMWGFVYGLAPVFNSLKVHVLYHRLELDRRRGVVNMGRLLTYLKLPRQASYLPKGFNEQARHVARFDEDYSAHTLLPRVGDDEKLVRELVSQVLLDAVDTSDFDGLLHAKVLRRLLATTKILAGIGDMERWYSLLDDPTAYQALKERVDIELISRNKRYYTADESVTVVADIKNVSTLVVKVFEINTFNYLSAKGADVDLSIDLDGLVASHEQTYTYDEPPLRRVRRTFDLETLDRPGVFVVELIGNGRSSRALIRKGRLHYLERVGAAGHVFTIVDEDNRPRPEATLWMQGKEYTPRDGAILVPFGTRGLTRTILLRDGPLTTLETFEHRGDKYEFTAGLYVDREHLLRTEKATLLVRPLLTIAGRPVSLSVLEKVRLTVESTDLHGVGSSADVEGFELFDNRESTYTFKVPDGLAHLTVTLRAERKHTHGAKQDFVATRSWAVNGIDASAHTEDLHLAHTAGGHQIQVLGKTGEVRADRPVSVAVSHRDYTQNAHLQLQTDVDGIIALGDLAGFTRIKASLPTGLERSWPLKTDGCRLTDTLHARVGESIHIPHMGPSTGVDRAAFSLLERRGSGYLADRRAHLSLEGGYLVCRDLPPGNYSLFLEDSGAHVELKVTDGERVAGWILGPLRHLERRGGRPLQITYVDASSDPVVLSVSGGSGPVRVHVIASSFLPAHDASSQIGARSPRERDAAEIGRSRSEYVSGRDIGDEYRYILERRHAEKYPGNMLTRPGLLINPWAVRETETEVRDAAGGEPMVAGAASEARARMRGGKGKKKKSRSKVAGAANLDFLGSASRVLANLKPDADGTVSIPRSELAAHRLVRVVAVDAVNTAWRSVPIDGERVSSRDLRLDLALDAERHFTEQKQITAVEGGQELVVADITTSALEVYDTTARVYRLFQTLSSDGHLQTFSFVLRWPVLTHAEKCALYSEYACHELSFFLSRRDPAFFAEVVAPYLRNKKHKTFLDHYLLGDDLQGYLRPWAHGRLNIVERILLRGHGRHASDLFDLLPPDVEGDNHRFRTAIQSGDLDTEDALGFDKAKAEGRADAVAANAPMPPPAARASRSRRRKRSAPPPMEEALDEFADMEEEEEPEPEYEADDDTAFFARDGLLAKTSRPMYRDLPTTQELAENNYYKLRVDEQGPELVTVNAFWRDFAAHDGGCPFLSKHFPAASRNFTEMMFALSVLDLPFDAEAPVPTYAGSRLTLRAGTGVVVFHKEIKPAELASDQTPILVNQNYLRTDDRYLWEGGERREKYVTAEMLVHTVYTCQVVLTNPTSSNRKLDLLLQIPRGSMPVASGFETRGKHLRLGPYATETVEYAFYFPAGGVWPHFPVHVASNEALIAAPDPHPLEVVAEPSTVDRDSWPWVSQNAENADVLAYLRDNNADRLELKQIAWRMGDRSFYDSVLSLLTARHIYDEVLWSYSLKHGDGPNLAEYLLHQARFLDGCGRYLASPILLLEPVSRGRYEHLEYAPLVNARAHPLGGRSQILNDRFSEQYRRFIDLLSYKGELDSDDWLSVAFYLLLQDRVSDGLDALDRVVATDIETRLQYDYLRAYAAFYTNPDDARQIAAPYAEYPVDRWRKLFANVLVQLDEAAGSVAAEATDPEDRDQAQDVLASTEPAIRFEIEAGQIALHYANLQRARINYYEMDIELLFSRQPFVQQQSGQFSFIAPNHSEVRDLPATGKDVFDLPEAYRSANAVVEVVAAGLKDSRTHYAHELDVRLAEAFGHLTVSRESDGSPVKSAYIKVYARFGGGTDRFYKDGYTDLRGRFDYSSLSTNELDGVQRFSILVMSDHGSVIREAAPPTR